MGDARRIDHLRALALSSMPSLARRPAQRQASGINHIVEQPITLPVTGADDKEEGELSPDDESERATTLLAAVESSLSFTRRNADLSLRASSKDKDERNTSAATSAESVPLVGVTTASVFSTSTRVSIVNKSQLFSAFSAQAPPLISSEPLEPVQTGSGVRIAVPPYKHASNEVNSSGALLNNYVRNAYYGSPDNSLQAPSTAASQLIPTPPNLSRFHGSGNGRICDTIKSNSSTIGSAGLQIRLPVPSSTLPSVRSPDVPTTQSGVARAASEVPVSATSITGGPGRNEAGVRKEAEAFLASLRIPLSNSSASGNENEDAFLIKFDDDSESDGENENRTNPSRRHHGRSSQKGITTSTGPVTTSAPLQSNPVIPTQSPADLTAEIDRMKKQIAAMERSKGKPAIPSVPGKASRVLPADIHRNVITPATESRPTTQLAAANVRPAPVDLESMRLRIAAKENELQQRRQRRGVKLPESGRGVSDAKKTSVALAPSLSPMTLSQASDSAAVHVTNSIGKSSEKGTSGHRKEVQARVDGIPALALAGPAGANLANFKKDVEQRGSDGGRDHQNSNSPVSNLACAQAGNHVGRISHQPASKGMKRSRSEEDGQESAKAPRWNKNSVSEMILAEESSKDATLSRNANDTLKSRTSFVSTVQLGKRKADSALMHSDEGVQGVKVDTSSLAGSEGVKKLKINSGGELFISRDDGGEDLLTNSKKYVAQDIPSHDRILSTLFPSEVIPTVSISAPLSVETERQRSSTDPSSSNAIRYCGATENAEAVRIQPSSHGRGIAPSSPPTFEDTALTASLTQSVVKTREFEQNAICARVAVTECQQTTLGRLNQNRTFSIEANGVQTTQPRKPVDPMSSANLDYRVEDSFRAGHSSIDNQHVVGKHATFQELLEEEELLDKQLEEVQRIRQQCEVRERIARREYREAQWTLRAANADCLALTQRKESLLSRIHAAEASHLSSLSCLDRPSLPLGGTVVTHKLNKPVHPPLLVGAPYSRPVSEAGEGSREDDVTVNRVLPALACESLSPFSSDRVECAVVPQRDAKSVLTAEIGEQHARYKVAKNVSFDDQEQESRGQLTVEVECRGRLENDSAVREREVQPGSVNAGRQADLRPGVSVDSASEAENQCYGRSEIDVNNNGSRNTRPANSNTSGPRVSNFYGEGQYNTVCMTNAADAKADEVHRSSSLEESTQVPLKSLSWIATDSTEQTNGLYSINRISTDVSRMGCKSPVSQQDDRYPVPAREQVLRSDSPKLMDVDPEGSDKDHVDANRVTASNSSQDARTWDSVRSSSEFVQDVVTADLDHSGSLEDANVPVDATIQDDSVGNVSQILEHVPTHFKDCSSGASASEFADADCRPEVRFQVVPDVVANYLFKESPGPVLPQGFCSLEQAVSVEKGTEAVESGGYADDVPLHAEGLSSLCSDSRNSLEASGVRNGFERINEKFSIDATDNVRLITEPQQGPSDVRASAIDNTLDAEETNRNDSPSDLPASTIDTLDAGETNRNDSDNTNMEISDALLSVVGQGPVILGNSSRQEAPLLSDERKGRTDDESSEEGVSVKPVYADVSGDPLVLKLEMDHAREMESPILMSAVHSGVGDIESGNGASGGEKLSPARPGSFVSSLQEEMDAGILREDCAGGGESIDCTVENTLADQFPINLVVHNLWTSESHHCQQQSEGRDPQYDRSPVADLADSRNLDKTELHGCSDNLDALVVSPRPDLKMVYDGKSTTLGFDHRNEDLGDSELCSPIASNIVSDSSKALSQPEFATQDRYLVMAVDSEGRQRDQWNADMSKSEVQIQEDLHKKESKGAEVEVFRKALIDENMFERRSTTGEEADATNLRKQNRSDVSKQVLPQLQQHRLEHLLDMVEVRVPELSSGGETLIQEVLQGEKDAGFPVTGDELQLDALILDSHDMVGPSGEQALSSTTASECVSGKAKLWVPSADSLVVLKFISTVQSSEAGSEMGKLLSESALKVSFETCVVPPHRYESPLSVFRSYSFCPQFSDTLNLSRRSITWSHAINPFKPLCKFEHRGKCNNDDCPWQHADDYAITFDDKDVAATGLDKDGNLGTTCLSLPTGVSPGTDRLAKVRLTCSGRVLPTSSMLPVFPVLNRQDVEVPIYRTGSYLSRAEDPMRMCFLSHNLQLDKEVDSSYSFLLSPSIHRPLPSDIPCLLDGSETPSWFGEAPSYHPGSPHWRYVRDIQEKLMCSKDGLELQELIDEEMWLELALHHIDYDLNTDNNSARDKALHYLSRALELKRSSVTLWVVYSFLFHMRKDNSEKDDMFHHAVRYNPASYELWVLYINSRSDFQSRLEAYEKAIVALADEGTQQPPDQDLSACLLDLALQMLYFWCVSGCSEDSFLWVDDLICEASANGYGRPHRGSTRALLSHLTQHDACVIWIACTYLFACKNLPNSIIARLGCRQELPHGLEWEKHAQRDELSRKRVAKVLSTAASEGLGCLSLGSAQAVVNKDNSSKQVLGLNYVQCLALYEGLDSAACFGKKLIGLHPTSLDLIVVCARIDEHRKGVKTGLNIFEEALLQWPHDLPGMQRLWNQYAGHALLWGGKDLAKTVFLNCAGTKKLLSFTGVEVSPRIPTEIPVSVVSLDKADGEGIAGEGWSRLREYFGTVTNVRKRSEGSNDQLSQVEDTVFALINLAVVEALSEDIAASQSAMNSAMKVAISHQDLRHCWKELAAQHVLCTKSAGWGNPKYLEQGILSLLDKCKTDSYNLSRLRPLSQSAFKNFKKPHVRKFLEDLIGPPPLDHSVLNSILQTLYGPQLLPYGSHPLKEVFYFAEGILEALPGNVLLASSLCKIVGQNRSYLKRMFMPAVLWSSALLISSLHESSPVAPEVYWVEAGSLMRQLDGERSLDEFYKLALSRYPFSAALRLGLEEVQDRLRVRDTLSQVVYKRSLDLVAEPMQVAVEC